MTKITVISHDNGQIVVHGEVPGGGSSLSAFS